MYVPFAARAKRCVEDRELPGIWLFSPGMSVNLRLAIVVALVWGFVEAVN